MIGTALTLQLEAQGNVVHRIVRRDPVPSRGDIVLGGGERDSAPLLDGCDAVVHLAGRNIATRWTRTAKAEIVRSRTETTRRLAESLAGLARPPDVLVCASGAGYYGDTGESIADERSPQGAGFLAEVVRAWEAAAAPARERGIRVVHLRFGLVLSGTGGALRKMLPAFRIGAGGPVGSGRQWLSWVALDDVLAVIGACFARGELAGPVNVVAPEPVRNADFARTLGRVLHRPAVLPLPAAFVRLAFGAMGEETLLASSRVAAARLRDLGFAFRYPALEGALRRAVGK
jgi:uncharacterized protein (TIGR01777 family)